ncbi:divergent PAP2 family protein [Patescibacteria group bacterium]|nr:divergent PAP2 family protein [Patescibacteria group bacterium]
MLEVIPKILIISLISGLAAQAVKILIKSTKNGKFNVKSVDDYGGMPSSHSAFLISLLTAIGLHDGVLSTSFAIACIMSTLLIRDAVGIRMELEQQGKFLKKVAESQQPQVKIADGIGHRIGHTYPEVIVGGAIGFALAFILYYLL